MEGPAAALLSAKVGLLSPVPVRDRQAAVVVGRVGGSLGPQCVLKLQKVPPVPGEESASAVSVLLVVVQPVHVDELVIDAGLLQVVDGRSVQVLLGRVEATTCVTRSTRSDSAS